MGQETERKGLVSIITAVIVALLLYLLFFPASESTVPPRTPPTIPTKTPPIAKVATPSETGSKSPPRAFPPICIVRDLCSGNPVAHVKVELIKSGINPEVAESNAAGEIYHDSESIESVAVKSNDWRCPPQAIDEVVGGKTLWVYKQIAVAVAVRADPSAGKDLDPDAVRVYSAWGGLPEDAAENSSPWTAGWMESHGFLPRPELVNSPLKDGVVRALIPRVRGMAVIADASGWRSAWDWVPVDPGADSQAVTLTLLTASYATGRVVTDRGEPVKGAEVHAYVTKTQSFAAVPRERVCFPQPNGGVTGAWSEKNNSAAITVHAIGATNATGEFSVGLKSDGLLRLVAYADGYEPKDLEVGVVAEDRQGLVITLTPLPESRRLRLEWDGKPLPDSLFIISDVSMKGAQPSKSYRTDSDGVINAQWIAFGRTYAVIPMSGSFPDEARGAHYLIWRGEDHVDIHLLPTKRP